MKIFGLLLALLLAVPCNIIAETIDVMITGQNIRAASPYLKVYRDACAKDGVNVNFVLSGSAMDYTAITLDVMKKFHVIVFHGAPVAMTSCKGTPEQAAAFRDNLEQFRKLGGGIIWMPASFKSMPREWTETVGTRYDVKALPEALEDKDKMVDVNPGMQKKMFSYIWTTNITPHPVTKDVHGLFLPMVGEWSWPGTVPMIFGPSWKVLISGMDTTHTIRNAAAAESVPDFQSDLPGTYKSSPQIVGVRDGQNGEGRMMVFPIYSAHTYQNYGHFVFNEALMKNGADGHPSDGHTMLLNAYRWLAAPAQAAHLGGYQAPDRADKVVNRAPIDWSSIKPLPADTMTGGPGETTLFRGIVGVKSSYGGGKGTVAQYAAQAKKLGLSYLVFLDDVAKLTPENYAKLIQDCAAVSDDKFLALPGYSFVDTLGNTFFLTNPKAYPDPEFLTKDHRVENFLGLMMKQSEAGVGVSHLGALPADPYYFYWLTCIAPFTWENGKMVDDGMKRYVALEGLGHAHAGFSVTEVTDPADLPVAAAKSYQTIMQVASIDQVREMLIKRQIPDNYPLYISNGPRIEQWATQMAGSQPMRPGGDRFRLSLAVSSDSDIKEVKIIDGQTGQPYRIFHPAPAKTFSCTIDESHTTQRYFIPVVTDTAGHVAIGSMLMTAQNANHMHMMTDRLMGMNHSLVYNAQTQQPETVGGWLGGVSWVKGHNAAGGYPSVGDTAMMRIFGFDGGNVYPGAIDISPRIETGDGAEPISPGYQFRNRLSSVDISLMDFDGSLQFKDKPDPGADDKNSVVKGIPIPTAIAQITSREWAVRPRAGTLTASNVHEISAQFKKATTFNRFDVCALRRWDKTQPCHWFIRDAAGTLDQLVPKGDPFTRSGVLRPGDYLYPANEIAGPTGIINLGPADLNYSADSRGARVYIDGKKAPVKAGDVVTANFIAFARDRGNQDNDAWLKKFITDFGIAVDKPGYDLKVTQGKLVSTNYSVDLQAVSGGAALEIKKYDLPSNVPVRVLGMPPHGLVGRYDPDRQLLLILPVFEGKVQTSVNTTLGDTKFYIGEILHWDEPDILVSAVPDGDDKLLVEVHNPTDKPRVVQLSAPTGFTPLKGLDQKVTVAPYSSTKLTLPTAPGTLKPGSYQQD